jgi:hypothetical protein
MAATELTRLPEHIYSGETIVVYFSLPDYLPADGWTLKMGASSADGATTLAAVSAADNGDGRHRLTLSAANTVTLGGDPGQWRYQLRVEHAAPTLTVIETGRFETHPDFQTAAADDRSHASKMLAAVNSLLLGTAGDNVQTLSVAGRSLSKYNPAELMDLAKYYEEVVEREEQEERIAQGRTSGTKILARM